MPDLTFKLKVFEYCEQLISERINNLNEQVALNKSSAAQETKSSMGDKYETGRAMAQLEEDKLLRQLVEASKLKQVLAQIKPDKMNTTGALGALVRTANIDFFIAVSLGKAVIDTREVYLISPVSPIGQMLQNKTSGDRFKFMKEELEIIGIC